MVLKNNQGLLSQSVIKLTLSLNRKQTDIFYFVVTTPRVSQILNLQLKIWSHSHQRFRPLKGLHKCNFKWLIMQRCQCPIHNGTLETLINHMEDNVVFLIRKVSISDNFFTSPYKQSHFRRENPNYNKQFKETKTWISNSYKIRQSC